MRILLSCLQSSRDHAVPAYRYWESYFKRGIEEAGHEWRDIDGVDWAEGLTHRTGPHAQAAEWRERTWSRVLDQLRAEQARRPVDLFLSYLYPTMVEPAAVEQIRAMGIPCVNFFCDNVREFVQVPWQFEGFDLNWVPELEATRFYESAGVPFIHAPMPTWIEPALRTCDHEERYGVSFIGSRDVLRELLIARALELGADIELRGAGWAPGPTVARTGAARKPLARTIANQVHFVQRFGVRGWTRKVADRFRARLSDEIFAPFVRPRPDAAEYVRVTQESRVTLGVTRYPSFRHPINRPETYARGRDIEAPMMGACYLTEWTEELPMMYDLGEEIETYRTAEEMVEKIRMLEADPARRRRMRCLAQRRALAEHSVPRSIARVAERLGVSTR